MRKSSYIGRRFGYLTVLEKIESDGNRFRYLCKCDCGAETVADIRNLRTGHTKSCGCYRRAVTSERNTTHGMAGTQSYKAWKGMIKRCENPAGKSYKNYGGRGINVCMEWRYDFLAYYSYISHLDNFGKPGYSLDRINNNGNYEPGNVRWATKSTQNNNTRSNHVIDIDGEKKTLAQWCRVINCFSGNACRGMRREGIDFIRKRLPPNDSQNWRVLPE